MKPHVFLCTPAYGGQVDREYALFLLDTQRAAIQDAFKLTVAISSGDSLITKARNRCAAEFIARPDMTHLFFFDADQGAPGDLLFQMLQKDKDILGCPVPKKKIRWDFAKAAIEAGANPEDVCGEFAANWKEENGSLLISDDGCVEAHGVGTGAMLIKRHVIQQMFDKFQHCDGYTEEGFDGKTIDAVDLFRSTTYHSGDQTLLMSEDYSFCNRWKSMGGKIHLFVNAHVSHVGRHVFSAKLTSHLEGM